MATYYINADTGNDTTGDGSQGNPWLTLSKTVSSTVSGDTIFVQNATNTYTITSNMNLSGRDIIGESTSGAVLTSNGNSINSGLVANSVTNLKFYNIACPNSYNAVLRANTYNCMFDTITGPGSYRMIWYGAFRVERCVIYNCTIANLFFVSNGNDLYFYNNVVHLNIANMDDFITNPSPTQTVNLYWKNNIFLLDGRNPDIRRGTVAFGITEFNNNCIYDGVINGAPNGLNNITSDPLFIDPDNNNYNLSPSSPCIDAGTLI
jgi:hypothetical protein